MQLIDQFAYSNAIRTVDPAYKAAVAASIVLLCLWLDRPLVGLVAVVWVVVLLVVVAGIPIDVVRRVLLAQTFFLILSTVAIIFSFSTSAPAQNTLWSQPLGQLWISTSTASLQQALHIITRALGSVAAMNFLALTTPMVDLIELLHRLCVPPVLINLISIMYRSVFLLFDTLNRMYTAQECRLGYITLRRGYVSAGVLGSQLFIDAYRRGQRLQLGMDSRGFAGELRVLPSVYRQSHIWFVLNFAVPLTLWLAGAIS